MLYFRIFQEVSARRNFNTIIMYKGGALNIQAAAAACIAVVVGGYIGFRLYNKFGSRSKKQRAPLIESGVVSKLIIYPIKSCGGVEVDSAECTPHGLVSGLLRDRFVSIAFRPSLKMEIALKG